LLVHVIHPEHHGDRLFRDIELPGEEADQMRCRATAHRPLGDMDLQLLAEHLANGRVFGCRAPQHVEDKNIPLPMTKL